MLAVVAFVGAVLSGYTYTRTTTVESTLTIVGPGAPADDKSPSTSTLTVVDETPHHGTYRGHQWHVSKRGHHQSNWALDTIDSCIRLSAADQDVIRHLYFQRTRSQHRPHGLVIHSTHCMIDHMYTLALDHSRPLEPIIRRAQMRWRRARRTARAHLLAPHVCLDPARIIVAY
jgi:hypothetical protein